MSILLGGEFIATSAGPELATLPGVDHGAAHGSDHFNAFGWETPASGLIERHIVRMRAQILRPTAAGGAAAATRSPGLNSCTPAPPASTIPAAD